MRRRSSTLLAGAAIVVGGSLPVSGALGQTLPRTLESPNGQLFGSFGLSIAAAGDVNGDGRPDVVVGADGEAGPTGNFAGRAYVFDGITGHVLHVLESPSHQSGSYFGTSVAGVGDVDGDGRGDVLVGARAAVSPTGSPAGRAFVFSGATGALIHDLIQPIPQAGSSFGHAVWGVEDVDGDTRPDLLVAAEGENTPAGDDAGRAYLFSGATGALLRVIDSPAAQPGGLFGQAVAGIGDMDGDGLGDLLISGANEQAGSPTFRPGRVHLLSGATSSPIRAFESPNPQHSGRFGFAVADAGDVNGDGIPDVLVGAAGESPAGANSGRAYVFSGASGEVLATLVSPNGQPTDFFGGSVSGAGDLDGDGGDDVLIGSPGDEVPGAFGAGRAYAFSGADGALLFTLESPNVQTGGLFGSAVAAAGDADGDGRPEVLVGAMGEDTPEGNAAGRAYVMAAPVATPVAPAPGASALHLVVAPNPAVGPTMLAFELPSASLVRLSVVDALGREVAVLVEAEQPAGSARITLDARTLQPGFYIVRLVTSQRRAHHTITVVDSPR